MSRTLASVVAWLIVTAIVGTPFTAFAAGADQTPSAQPQATVGDTAVAPNLDLGQIFPSYRDPMPKTTTHRPAALPMLYVTLGVLQATDLYTTHVGLQLGATESNPVLGKSAGQNATMLGSASLIMTRSTCSSKSRFSAAPAPPA